MRSSAIRHHPVGWAAAAGAGACLALGMADLVVLDLWAVPRAFSSEPAAPAVAAGGVGETPLPPAGEAAETLLPTPPRRAPTRVDEASSRAAASRVIDEVEVPAEPLVLSFPTNVAALDRDHQRSLDAVARTLLAHPGWSLSIDGHTDDRGSERYNRQLSVLRARVVSRHLQARGVAPDRMTVRGWGFDRPRQAGATRAARVRNRRTEIHLSGRRT